MSADFSAKVSLLFESNIAKVSAKVDKSTTKITKSMGKLDKKLGKVAKRMGKVGKALKDKISKGFDNAAKKVAKFTGKLGSIAASGAKGAIVAIVTAVTAAIAGFAKLSLNTLDFADRAGKMSKNLGVSTKFYQQFTKVAGDARIPIEQSEDLLKNLGKAMGESRDPANEFAKIFKAFDIDPTEKLEKVLPKLVNRFADMKDEGLATALKMKVFGENGFRAGVLFEKGWEPVVEKMSTVKVISDKTIKSSEKLNDTINNLKSSFIGLGDNLGPMFERITKIVDKFTEWVNTSEDAEKIMQGMANITIELLNTAESIGKAFGNYPTILKTTVDTLKFIEKGLKGVQDTIAIVTGKQPETDVSQVNKGGKIISGREDALRKIDLESRSAATAKKLVPGTPEFSKFVAEDIKLLIEKSKFDVRGFMEENPQMLIVKAVEKLTQVVKQQDPKGAVFGPQPAQGNQQTPFFMNPTFNQGFAQ